MWNVELSASPMKNYSIKNYNILHSTFNIATGNNSTFNTPHSTLPQATIQHPTFNIQKMDNPEFREGLEDLASHYKSVITLLGEDVEREGLQKTPMRVAKAMQVLTRGYSQDPHKVLTDALFKEDYKQMVVVKDIDVFSLCEHHMLPFYGKAHVAYIPNGYITGLSKIARVVDIFSHRLQVQERLTQQIRECIEETLHPLGVMVVIEAKHMCMQMRGVEKQSSITMTSDFSGAFEQAKTRQEFMNLINSNSHKF